MKRTRSKTEQNVFLYKFPKFLDETTS